MSDLQLLLLVAAIALAIGVAIGALVFAARNPGSSKPADPTQGKGELALLRVWRDPVHGRLIVGLKAEQANTPSDLSPASLDILQHTLDELRRWVGIQSEATISPEPLAAAGQELSASSAIPSITESKPERISPVDVFARAIRTDTRKPETPPASIAAQIDEILQEKLTTNPTITRAVRLLEIPGKGMFVMVGLDQYAGVDEVPDAEVRGLIREAVAEWERRVES